MNRSAGDRRWVLWLSATTAFAIIGCTWALATARYGGPDEPAHVIRAAAASHGDLRGQPVATLEPGYRQVRVAASLASGDPACYRHDETITAACAIASNSSADVAVATSAGTPPPWYYGLTGIVTRVFSSGGTVMGYRMAAVLLCAITLGYAMLRGRGHGASAWLMLALTPSAWFLLGVVGTSSMEVALIALALVEAVGRFHTGRSASLARVGVPLALCLLLRPAAFIDIVVVALVVISTIPRPVTIRRLTPLVTPLVIAGSASLLWNHWTGLIVSDRRTADDQGFVTALRNSVEGIPTTAHQAIGALGWNEFYAPIAAQLVWVATLIFAAYWTVSHSPARWWHVRWIAIGLLLPTIIEVIVHRRIGQIWQGRYSICFAMGGVLYAARCPSPPRRVMRGLVLIAASAEVLTLWHTLRRYMVGLDGSLTLQNAAWSPPLSPWLLIVLNGAAIAWLAATAMGLGDDVSEHVDDVLGRSGVVVQREVSA